MTQFPAVAGSLLSFSSTPRLGAAPPAHCWARPVMSRLSHAGCWLAGLARLAAAGEAELPPWLSQLNQGAASYQVAPSPVHCGLALDPVPGLQPRGTRWAF